MSFRVEHPDYLNQIVLPSGKKGMRKRALEGKKILWVGSSNCGDKTRVIIFEFLRNEKGTGAKRDNFILIGFGCIH